MKRRSISVILVLMMVLCSIGFAFADSQYTVVKDDTLAKIAKKYGITYQELAEYNNIKNLNFIKEGQVIKIPSAVVSVPAQVQPSTPAPIPTPAPTQASADEKGNEAINAAVYEEFVQLTKIPRKSGHEKAVSDYLLKRVNDMGYSAVQDSVNNVIVECPATSGYEKLPMVILQVHMDMVAIAEDGVAFDPLTDPIKIQRDGNLVTAEGTTLGADDGIGVAIVLNLLKSKEEHGPMRILFTVDEEMDMTGASNIDAKYLEGKYLINIDWETRGSLCNSSADANTQLVRQEAAWKPPVFQTAYTLTLDGLLGGHSGLMIVEGRANAIRVVADYLQRLENMGIDYELAEINGGVAKNSIPVTCKAVFTVKNSDAARVQEEFEKFSKLFGDTYNVTEKDYEFTMVKTDIPKQVLGGHALVSYISTAPINVHTMSQTVEGLVESSSNIGMITTGDKDVEMQVFSRSSSGFQSEEIANAHRTIATALGLQYESTSYSPGWMVNADSVLTPLMAGIFKEQNGIDMKVEPVHAGLECGWFIAKNENLDIVSIGPQIDGAHTVSETLHYDSLAETYKLVCETLKRLR